MSARASGWALLVTAVLAAGAVLALGLAHGGSDPVLAVVAAGGLLLAGLVVVHDHRRARQR